MRVFSTLGAFAPPAIFLQMSLAFAMETVSSKELLGFCVVLAFTFTLLVLLGVFLILVAFAVLAPYL